MMGFLFLILDKLIKLFIFVYNIILMPIQKHICFIYFLEFEDGELYVGSTIDPDERQKAHCHYGWEIKNKRKTKKIKKIIPVFNIVEKIRRVDRHFWELFYMQLFRSWGFTLKNKMNIVNLKNRKDL